MWQAKLCCSYFSIAVGGLLLCGLLFLLSLRHPLIIYHRKVSDVPPTTRTCSGM